MFANSGQSEPRVVTLVARSLHVRCTRRSRHAAEEPVQGCHYRSLGVTGTRLADQVSRALQIKGADVTDVRADAVRLTQWFSRLENDAKTKLGKLEGA